MKVQVLASGSKGNVTIVKVGSHNILIDAGIPLSAIIKRVDIFPDIDIMIITHTHNDHIKGIKSYISRYKPEIYCKSSKLKELYPELKINNINYEDNEIIIRLFPLSHDTPCCGVSITEKGSNKELIYITDTGYINQRIISRIINKDIYIIESNHDVEKLRKGKYPIYLQERIWSDKGHLSNEQCSEYLKVIIGERTKYVVLAHLSEENNSVELAKKEATKVLDGTKIKLLIAKQDQALDIIEV